MLGFSLSPDQLTEKERAHTFAEKIMRPVARKYDETGEWAVDVYKAAFDYGYLQALVPEDCGGPGASQMDEAIVCEELSWGCAGLAADEARFKYGCAKALRILSEQRPELLYPHFDFFARLLAHENKLLQWEAAFVLSQLARVDTGDKFAGIFRRYFSPISGPVMITAATVIQAVIRLMADQHHARNEARMHVGPENREQRQRNQQPGLARLRSFQDVVENHRQEESEHVRACPPMYGGTLHCDRGQCDGDEFVPRLPAREPEQPGEGHA